MTVITDGEWAPLTPRDPTAPQLPLTLSRVGQLENDKGYITESALSDLATHNQVARAVADSLPAEAASGFATSADGAKARSAVQPDELGDFVTHQLLAEGLASVATSEQGDLADTAVQPDALSQRLAEYAPKQLLSEAEARCATAEQGQLAASAVQPDELASYALKSDLASYLTSTDLGQALSQYATASALQNYVSASALSTALAGFATRSQGDKADMAVQPAVLSEALSTYATSAALWNGLAGRATAQQGAKADSAVQPSALASYATTTALTQGLATKATSAQGAKADSALQPPAVPLARTLAFATAYQADQKDKSAMLSIMVRMAYTVTVAGLMTDEVELRIGPAADVATGGGYRVASAEGGVTGIALIIGTTVITRPQLFAMIPPGWYFAIRRLAGTGATLHSAFLHPLG